MQTYYLRKTNMKIVTIIGARPQFVKAAMVSKQIRKEIKEILIHTGQHYDINMSEIFFKELSIPTPDYNLNIGSGSHARQTGLMMIGIEDILLKESPDAVLIYGDTNSTLAGAISAGKLNIPIIHVEAGLRSFNMQMPEEQNRILSDHLSSFLFCSTDTGCTNLRNEGILNHVYNVGDVMCDAVLKYSQKAEIHNRKYYFSKLVSILQNEIQILDEWYLTTIHRAENTNKDMIKTILDALNELDAPVLFPVHPRIKQLILDSEAQSCYNNLVFIEPVGYSDMVYFTKNAKKVITDSGGLQKECYILNTPCITVRKQTEWVETLIGNHNILASPNKQDILSKVLDTEIDYLTHPSYYGNGDAAQRIVAIIKKELERNH